MEHPRTKKLYALKRITCHSTEDQIAATKEVEFHKQLGSFGSTTGGRKSTSSGDMEIHPGSKHVLGLVGSEVIGNADIVHNKTSEVLLLLPFLKVYFSCF